MIHSLPIATFEPPFPGDGKNTACAKELQMEAASSRSAEWIRNLHLRSN